MDRELKAQIMKIVQEHVESASTIEEVWKLFAGLVLPPNVPPIQFIEMRKAFYAGAAAMLELVMMVGDDSFEEDAGVQRLESLSQELTEFAKSEGL